LVSAGSWIKERGKEANPVTTSGVTTRVAVTPQRHLPSGFCRTSASHLQPTPGKCELPMEFASVILYASIPPPPSQLISALLGWLIDRPMRIHLAVLLLRLLLLVSWWIISLPFCLLLSSKNLCVGESNACRSTVHTGIRKGLLQYYLNKLKDLAILRLI
jgi:hypothetical protein